MRSSGEKERSFLISHRATGFLVKKLLGKGKTDLDGVPFSVDIRGVCEGSLSPFAIKGPGVYCQNPGCHFFVAFCFFQNHLDVLVFQFLQGNEIAKGPLNRMLSAVEEF